jgi:hypothetical protein
MPRSTRGPTGENAGAAAGGGGGVGPPKVYPEEKSESATEERKLSIGCTISQAPQKMSQWFMSLRISIEYQTEGAMSGIALNLAVHLLQIQTSPVLITVNTTDIHCTKCSTRR